MLSRNQQLHAVENLSHRNRVELEFVDRFPMADGANESARSAKKAKSKDENQVHFLRKAYFEENSQREHNYGLTTVYLVIIIIKYVLLLILCHCLLDRVAVRRREMRYYSVKRFESTITQIFYGKPDKVLNKI
uniref:Uncharacterized protein n=1 Tax=Glossina brevipalpis TaxID=37001 RepID=A0A1A9WEM4_9MUSC